ncbi:MAG: glycoside hydrolase family 130 protein [Verrucomicrobiota bacterium]
MKTKISSMFAALACALAPISFAAGGTAAGVPDWGLGPFTRPADAQPIIKPDTNSIFNCPMRKAPVHWEATHTFNPAAIVKDGKVYILYRAEDNIGSGIGGFTSRLGLAVSEDGIHFKKMPAPVLFPAEDAQKEHEWEGGCEDPRIVETEDGTYVLLYTQYQRMNAPKKEDGFKVLLGVATSKDLIHWTKLGAILKGWPGYARKSASFVCKVVGDRLIAARIKGRYWLYYGEGQIRLASSEDLVNWEIAPGSPPEQLDEKAALLRGDPKNTDKNILLARREGKFDAMFPEAGPPALLTEKGIVFLYNGKNGKALGDLGVGAGAYTGGQALFSADDPRKLLDRTDVPFIKPELSWEKTGQYSAGTTFIEGLILFKNQWFLYYGCADTFVGVANAPTLPWQLHVK